MTSDLLAMSQTLMLRSSELPGRRGKRERERRERERGERGEREREIWNDNHLLVEEVCSSEREKRERERERERVD